MNVITKGDSTNEADEHATKTQTAKGENQRVDIRFESRKIRALLQNNREWADAIAKEHYLEVWSKSARRTACDVWHFVSQKEMKPLETHIAVS